MRIVVDALRVAAPDTSAATPPGRLPASVRAVLDEVTNARDPDVTVSVEDVERLLLSLDAALGDGSGRTLEEVGVVLGTRLFAGASHAGDVRGALEKLGTPLEQLVGSKLQLRVQETAEGFSVGIEVLGRPAGAWMLRHLASGYARAALSSARASSDSAISGEVVGDRVTLRIRPAVDVEPQSFASRGREVTRRPTLRMRVPGVSAEVDRILGGTRGSDPAAEEQRASSTLPTRPPGQRRSKLESGAEDTRGRLESGTVGARDTVRPARGKG